MTTSTSSPPSGSTSSTLGRGSTFVPPLPRFPGTTTAATGRGVALTPSPDAPSPGAATLLGKGKEPISSPPDGVEGINDARSRVPDRVPPPITDTKMITLTVRQLDSLLTKAVEDVVTARGIPVEPPRIAERGGAGGREMVSISSQAISRDEEIPPEETKPPSRVDTALAPPRGARDPNAFTGADGAQDMEESTDNEPPAVIGDQLEAFRKEIEVMHKQIHDRVSNPRPITGRQFTPKILQDELPFNIKPLNCEYDGTTDPYEHLMRFKNSTILHRYGEGVKCRVFLTTLSKAAQ
ncbi:hypothetical protein ACS0TY_032262 [Phlomoides rotata]